MATRASRILVLDTSSLLGVRYATTRGDDRRDALDALMKLVKDGTLLFPPQVRKEVEDGEKESKSKEGPAKPPSEFLTWIVEAKQCGAERRADDQITKEALSVVEEVVDVDAERDQADPHVLGLAVELGRAGHAVTVVTDDTKDGPPSKVSLASACGALDIPSIRIALLLKRIRRETA